VAEVLPGADDHRDPGRIDELALAEVDQQRLAGSERLLQRALQFGGGAEVELAAHGDDPDTVLQRSRRSLEGPWTHARDATAANPGRSDRYTASRPGMNRLRCGRYARRRREDQMVQARQYTAASNRLPNVNASKEDRSGLEMSLPANAENVAVVRHALAGL